MPRLSDREYQAQLKLRQHAAGKFGFGLGSVAALLAASINLWRAPRPWSVASVALALLMAALNVPLGIGIGLLLERVSRPKE